MVRRLSSAYVKTSRRLTVACLTPVAYRILAPQDAPDTEDFLASCITYRRTVLVKQGDEPVRSVQGQSIAAVLVPPENRRKGYAQQMMLLLHKKIAEGGNSDPKEGKVKPSELSFLYSDVGTFYELLGWMSKSDLEMVWRVDSLPQVKDAVSSSALSTRSVSIDDIEELAKLDAKMSREAIEQSSAGSASELYFSIVDEEGFAWLWHFMRSKCAMQHHSKSAPQALGARLLDSNGNLLNAFAVWAHTPNKDAQKSGLVLLRWHFENEEQLLKLLEAALERTKEDFGTGQVTAWNVDLSKVGIENAAPGPISELANGNLVHRGSSLPSVSAYGPLAGSNLHAAQWLHNEKGWWC